MNISAPWPDPEEAKARVLGLQTKLHQWAGRGSTCSKGMSMWRAGCAGTCTSGSEGGPGKSTGREPGRASRPDPYRIKTHHGNSTRNLAPHIPAYEGEGSRCNVLAGK